MRQRPFRLAAALLLALSVMALLGARSLPAAVATSGSLSMTSDPGDFVGQGQDWSYTAGPDIFSSQLLYRSEVEAGVDVIVHGANGDSWRLDFSAPFGAHLTPGTYSDAARWPFEDPSQPGLEIDGNGRGCNMLTGNFTVLDATYGPDGSVQTFHATFEQHCEGAVAALRGEVQLTNPPPVHVTLTVDPKASVRPSAEMIHGTVTCSRPATVLVTGTITQETRRSGYNDGGFNTTLPCSTTATPWAASANSNNGPPFLPGSAQIDASSAATDESTDTAHAAGTIQFTTAR
jgi:hypothetical protein